MSDDKEKVRVYLDANVFIYALEGYERYSKVLADLSDRLEEGEIHGVTSELTLAETLVRPIQLRDSRLEAAYESALCPSAFLDVVPIGGEVLRRAARLRARVSGLRLPDAIHVATAILQGCATFFTNDSALRRLDCVDVVLLSDLVAR